MAEGVRGGDENGGFGVGVVSDNGAGASFSMALVAVIVSDAGSTESIKLQLPLFKNFPVIFGRQRDCFH